MNHLQTNYWDLENNVFRSDLDDFILPEDEDAQYEKWRQQDIDLDAEVKRISDWNRSLTNPLLKKQAD